MFVPHQVMLDCPRKFTLGNAMSYHPRSALTLLTGTILALSACASAPDLDVTIHESKQGAIYLERIPDRSFQASHPITLSADTMARVLRGVVVKDTRGVLGSLAGNAGKLEAVRAFGDEEVEYLTPLLVAGLARAASDQQVGFRIVQSGAQPQSQSSGTVICLSDVRFPGVCASEQKPGTISEQSTEGSLYAYGQSLYLTLIAYRHWTEQAETSTVANRRIVSPAGFLNRTVHFVPESAKRPDSYRTARSTDTTVVIDYNLLATMPVTPDVRPTSSQSPTPVKGQSAQRDADMDELRKEMQEIKKKLAEQEEERIRSSPSSSKKLAPR